MEFFGIDFGSQPCEICKSCGEEFISDEVMEIVDVELKKRKLFGIEKRVKISKSGRSVIVKVPDEITGFKIHKRSVEIELAP